jgi:hypothetical protein
VDDGEKEGVRERERKKATEGKRKGRNIFNGSDKS